LSNQAKQADSNDSRPTGLLLVSQPNAPGQPPIAERVAINATILDGDDATVADCINEMRSSSCVHLACHGFYDPVDLLRSGFLLRDGRLEFSEIIQGGIKITDFIFLSIRQTITSEPEAQKGGNHLAAGMFAAGYRSVVGTMWPVGDDIAPRLSEEFYRRLLAIDSLPTTVDISRAAEALHHSTAPLRKNMGTSDAAFLAWVPYVHFGL
jgi:CHAT domain-containing protein